MPTDTEIERALAAITASLNEQELEGFDTAQIQQIVDQAVAQEGQLTVDDGGGLHAEDGRRIGAIRRTDSGEWVTERQNPAAEHSEAAIPARAPQGKLRKLLIRLKPGG